VITVNESQVRAVLIGGQWWNVTAVTVDWAEYESPGPHRFGRGLHLQATLGPGGPNAGDRLVAPLSRVEAVRMH
jgi:hypothetical protein